MQTTIFKTVGIVGTGAMGRGIAQIAAQAGSRVKLMDAQAGAAEKAHEALCSQWDKLVEKGRIGADAADGHKARLRVAGTLADLSDCDLVIEAIGWVLTSPRWPWWSGWTRRAPSAST